MSARDTVGVTSSHIKVNLYNVLDILTIQHYNNICTCTFK